MRVNIFVGLLMIQISLFLFSLMCIFILICLFLRILEVHNKFWVLSICSQHVTNVFIHFQQVFFFIHKCCKNILSIEVHLSTVIFTILGVQFDYFKKHIFCHLFATKTKIQNTSAPHLLNIDTAFLQIEDLCQPALSRSIDTIFSHSICSLYISVLHFGNSQIISNLFC